MGAEKGRQRRKTKIGGAFAPRLIEMIASPAFRVLSLTARKILDRLEIELARHGGMDNGELPTTYEHFVEYGVDRHAIGPALRELQALGFIEVTPGAAGNAEFRRPNLFRLTYRHTEGGPTDDWKRVRSVQEAGELARAARKPAPSKTKRRWEESTSNPVRETHIETPDFPVWEPPTTARGETLTTSISREGAPVGAEATPPALSARSPRVNEDRARDGSKHHTPSSPANNSQDDGPELPEILRRTVGDGLTECRS